MKDKLPEELSYDEQAAVVAMTEHPGFRPLLKLLDRMVFEEERRFTKERVDANKLAQTAVRKAQVEGAELFVTRLQRNLQQLSRLVS